jgi:putative endonuclease
MARQIPSFVYILECSDGTYYTGWTNSLDQRIKAHNSARGAKYTRSRLPVRLVYQEQFQTESEARKREAQLKGWTRADKRALIEGDKEKT